MINEDPNTKIIRELKEEVAKLREQLLTAASGPLSPIIPGPEKVVIKEQLQESEKLLTEIEKPWDDRVKDTEVINAKRQKALKDMGIEIESNGIKINGKSSFLVNLNPDPALSEILVYNLPEDGDAIIGCGENAHIQLHSFGIADHHATISVSGKDFEIRIKKDFFINKF